MYKCGVTLYLFCVFFPFMVCSVLSMVINTHLIHSFSWLYCIYKSMHVNVSCWFINIDEYLSCCQCFGIMGNASVNICVYVSHTHIWGFLCGESSCSHIFSFVRGCQMFFEFTHPSAVLVVSLTWPSILSDSKFPCFWQFDFLKTQYFIVLFEFPSLLVSWAFYWLLRFLSLWFAFSQPPIFPMGCKYFHLFFLWMCRGLCA